MAGTRILAPILHGGPKNIGLGICLQINKYIHKYAENKDTCIKWRQPTTQCARLAI